MASPPAFASALLLSSVLFLLTLGAAARPCKTLVISYAISSTTYGGASFGSASTSASAFEVSQIAAAGEQVPSRFFTIYRLRSYASSSAAASAKPLVANLCLPIGIKRPTREDLSFGGSSVRERARDILIVVADILFGIGCGGLASVTMYLVQIGCDGSSHGDDPAAAVPLLSFLFLLLLLLSFLPAVRPDLESNKAALQAFHLRTPTSRSSW